MGKNIIYYNFFVSSIIGLSVYAAQFYSLKLPSVINNYLNDFLIIPIVLTVSLFVLRIIKHNKSYVIPIGIILFLSLGYSVFFEMYMPTVSIRYTADFVDVLLYVLGGLWFWFLQKKEYEKPEC